MAWRAEEEKRSMSLFDATRRQLQVHEQRCKIPEGWKATAIFAMTSNSAIKLFMVIVYLVASIESGDLSDLGHEASGRYLSRCFGFGSKQQVSFGLRLLAFVRSKKKRGSLLFVLSLISVFHKNTDIRKLLISKLGSNIEFELTCDL